MSTGSTLEETGASHPCIKKGLWILRDAEVRGAIAISKHSRNHGISLCLCFEPQVGCHYGEYQNLQEKGKQL